jgi:hypothetical protein
MEDSSSVGAVLFLLRDDEGPTFVHYAAQHAYADCLITILKSPKSYDTFLVVDIITFAATVPLGLQCFGLAVFLVGSHVIIATGMLLVEAIRARPVIAQLASQEVVLRGKEHDCVGVEQSHEKDEFKIAFATTHLQEKGILSLFPPTVPLALHNLPSYARLHVS